MKRETEKSFDAILDQALRLIENGTDVETIVARFPKHAERLREMFMIGPAVREAVSGVVPPERLLRSIIRVIDTEPVARPTFSSLVSSWRMSIPIAVVGAIAALFAIVREPQRLAPPILPLADTESTSPVPRVAMKSAGELSVAAVTEEGVQDTRETEILSAPTASAPVEAFAPGSASPAEPASDFLAIFNEEDAAFAAGENDVILAHSDISGFNAIGNSYDENTL